MKTLDNFKIVLKDGTTYDMAADFDVLVRRFTVSSPRPEITTEKVEGRSGAVRLGKTWGQRKITADCSMFATDVNDVALLQNEIKKALMGEDEFYVICDAEPGKRWLVEIADEWTPEKLGTYGEFTLTFVSHSPYAFEAEFSYTHTDSSFSIFNAGDVSIDPRFMALAIEYKGASTNLSIKNVTTGEEWVYTGTSNSTDVIKLDGIRSTKNDLSIFRSTNKKLISLKSGWNDFVLSGTSESFEIKFDFCFYYL